MDGSSFAAWMPGTRPGDGGWKSLELVLVVEPFLASLQNVRPLLLGGVRELFLSVILRRWKNRQIIVAPKVSPRSSINFARSSASVASRCAAAARMKSAWRSMRCERLSPPDGLAAQLPVARTRSIQRTGLVAILADEIADVGDRAIDKTGRRQFGGRADIRRNALALCYAPTRTIALGRNRLQAPRTGLSTVIGSRGGPMSSPPDQRPTGAARIRDARVLRSAIFARNQRIPFPFADRAQPWGD
jgi:hypothetical protein